MVSIPTQQQLHTPSALLDEHGRLRQVGWSRQPLLDCNLENARFYSLRFLQRFRIKRWDYYGVTTPTHFFSATIGDIGYLGSIFVYLIDLATGEYPRRDADDSAGARHRPPAQQHRRESLCSTTARYVCTFPRRARGPQAIGDVAELWRARLVRRGDHAPATRARIHDHRHPHRRQSLLLQPQGQLYARPRVGQVGRHARSRFSPRTAWATWTGDAACGNTTRSGYGPAHPAFCRMAARSA